MPRHTLSFLASLEETNPIQAWHWPGGTFAAHFALSQMYCTVYGHIMTGRHILCHRHCHHHCHVVLRAKESRAASSDRHGRGWGHRSTWWSTRRSTRQGTCTSCATAAVSQSFTNWESVQKLAKLMQKNSEIYSERHLGHSWYLSFMTLCQDIQDVPFLGVAFTCFPMLSWCLPYEGANLYLFNGYAGSSLPAFASDRKLSTFKGCPWQHKRRRIKGYSL